MGIDCNQRRQISSQLRIGRMIGVLWARTFALNTDARFFRFTFVVVRASVATTDRIDHRDANIGRILAYARLVGDVARAGFEFAELSIAACEPGDSRAQLTLG